MKRTMVLSALLMLAAGGLGCEDNPLGDLISVTVSPQLAKIDPATGDVEYLQAAPTMRTGFPVVIGHGEKLFVIGGTSDTFELIDDVDIYDTVSGSWTKGEPWPTRRDFVIPFVVGERICIGGGSTLVAQPINAFDCFNTTTETWDVNEPLPDSRQTIAMGTHDGKVYAFGGVQGSADYTDSAHVFDFAVGSWQPIATLPDTCDPINGVVTLNDKLYVFQCDGISVYDPVADAWDPSIEYTAYLSVFPRVELIDNKMYVYLSGADNNRVDILDPANSTQPWSYSPEVEPGSEASDYVGTQHGGQLYVAIDGSKDTVLTHGLYRYDPQAEQWSHLASIPPRELDNVTYEGLVTIGDSLYLPMAEEDSGINIGQ